MVCQGCKLKIVLKIIITQKNITAKQAVKVIKLINKEKYYNILIIKIKTKFTGIM